MDGSEVFKVSIYISYQDMQEYWFQVGTFFRVARSESRYVFTSGFFFSPCKSFYPFGFSVVFSPFSYSAPKLFYSLSSDCRYFFVYSSPSFWKNFFIVLQFIFGLIYIVWSCLDIFLVFLLSPVLLIYFPVCNVIAEGFRFMPLSLVRLRTFRLSTWVS